MTIDKQYIHRCIQLARLGLGTVAPNPLVGAVLVFQKRIIGEGYHKKYGEPHAEVNCINSVSDEDKRLISSSTLYVSLEPCVHFGKTPPCTDLIIRYKIPKVVIGCSDPFSKVNGKGIEKLQEAGIVVVVGVLEDDCKMVNKRFFTFHSNLRPYILLKWAQTANQKIAGDSSERLFITNEFSNRLVHKWRSEEMAMVIGTNTAMLDDPQLNSRFWSGKNPIRIVVDLDLKLSPSLRIFDRSQKTIVFNCIKQKDDGDIVFCLLRKGADITQQILAKCYQLDVQSLMVEGGAKTLQSFIDDGLWDEARVITNTELQVENGLAAPQLFNHHHLQNENLGNDRIDYYSNKKISFK